MRVIYGYPGVFDSRSTAGGFGSDGWVPLTGYRPAGIGESDCSSLFLSSFPFFFLLFSLPSLRHYGILNRSKSSIVLRVV